MPRNRQLSRLVHVSRRRRKSPAQADPPMPRRRALRRYAVPAAAAALLLIVTQVVLAVPPTNVSFTVDDSTPRRGQEVTFTASDQISDPDGGTITSYDWDFGDGTVLVNGGPSVQHTYSTLGTKPVTLTVTDSAAEKTTSAPQNVEVVNVPPTAAVSCSPSTVSPGVFTCDGSGSSDPDNSSDGNPTAITQYEWDIDGDGFNNGSDPQETFSLAAGDHTIRLRVTDSDGARDIAQQQVNVANAPPTAAISCSPAQVNAGDPVNCTSTGSSDPAPGSIVSYEWQVDNGPFSQGGPNFSTTTLPPGDHRITLRVTDNGGATATATSSTISVNAKPVADIVAAAAAPPPPNLPADAQVNAQINQQPPTPTPLVGQRVVLDGSGSTDPGGAVTSYAWDVDGSGFDPADSTAAQFVHIFTSPGLKTIRLRVRDAQNAESVDAVQLRVNSLPEAGFITDDATPVINQNIALVSTSSDPDNDISQYAWDFDNDGQFGEAAQAAGIVCQSPQSPNASCRFDAAGLYTVKLRVTDTGGISRTATRELLIQNSVPTAAFSFGPNWSLPGEPVTFTSTSTATAGKQLTGYEWDFDYQQASGDPCATFTADARGPSVAHGFSSPGPKVVALKVTEAAPGGGPETGGCDVVADDSVRVNAPPRAGFTVSPQEAFVGDGVTLSSTSADPDGPLTRQDWDLDNDGQFDDANAVVVSANFTSAGTYPLALRVTDERGATATATGQVVIRTRPVPPTPPPPPTPLLSGVLIELQGQLKGKYTKVRRLLVRAPKDSMITVRCLGKKCPKRMTKQSKGSKKLRFKKLERRFRPKTKLIVSVTKNGFIGKQTRWTMRRRKAPLRQDLCLVPGAKKATPCPPG
jgi:PKD repeat protein